MVDFWGKKKKRGPRDFEDPFDDFFGENPFGGDFAERIREMNKDIMEQMRRTMQEQGASGPGQARGGQPKVYGFKLTLGPNGKPNFEEFGNVRSGKAREPLVDVIPKQREITVVAELPGVQKKDIKVKIIENDDVLHINVPNKFDKKVKLPARVKPKQTKASYKNGVLEVNLVRVKEAKKKRDKDEIPVE
jgi:HSP20 family protein